MLLVVVVVVVLSWPTAQREFECHRVWASGLRMLGEVGRVVWSRGPHANFNSKAREGASWAFGVHFLLYCIFLTTPQDFK